ncbi:hypothetical protein [Mucilaginibacter sp. dw_454]|uniref:hypothetical protein n=1 Tax=Mucilaginibacter sp. dw_454 TaxID=2720079 RepID=UPI001BD35EFE|nr:hypothetical protein [Mucilaginibacter sp. dw_454]
MRAENPAALKYIFQDEIYILPNEKTFAPPIAGSVPLIEPAEVIEPVPVVEEPAPITVAQVDSESVKPEAEILQPEPQTPPPATKPFNYLGANKKSFLIFTHYTGHDFMDQEHLTALQNILKRKEVELDDVAILNIAKIEINKWGDIYRFFAPKKVLVLGKNAIPAGLNVPELNQLKQAPAASLLYSFSFDEMMSSTDNKKAFWEQMKNL